METKDQARKRVMREQEELRASLDAMSPQERAEYRAKQPDPFAVSKPNLTDDHHG